MLWLRRAFLAAFLALLGCASETPPPVAERSPNIVILLVDDLGHGDLGVTGAPDIRTPHIDSLARDGVRFVHAYANAPVCSPTRAALLSGQYQQRVGMDRVLYVDERELGLATDVRLLPSYLAEAGYVSGVFGKWHLGQPVERFPTRFGFDEFVGFTAGNIDYFDHTDRLGKHDLYRGEEEAFDERYATDLFAEEAVDFIERHAAEPFLLYVPFNAPHDPFQGPEHRATAGDQEVTRQVNRTREVFRSMVESVDANVGKILAKLEAEGLTGSTAVFFLSDNGGLPIVARNAPFSEFKTTLWEGGIRTALLARFPGRFPAGLSVAEPVIAMDLFPTALEMAGMAPPAEADGRSLLGLLEGSAETLERQALYFRYDDPSDEVPQRAMVEREWKYLVDEQGDSYLFDVQDDPAEQNNVKASEVERFERMEADWLAWQEDVLSGRAQQPRRKN